MDNKSKIIQEESKETNIILKNDIKIIGEYAFAFSGLETIEIPTSVKSIGYDAFSECKSLRNVILHEGLESIEHDAFSFSGLEEIEIPASVKNIGEKAFYDCKSLRNITLHEGLKSIVDAAFLGSGLETIEIPASVKNIGDRAFLHCKSLRNATLHEGLESIGNGAFLGSGLETIEIPASVKSTGNNAFYGCESLRNATLHEGLESIEHAAFLGSGLEAIEIPASVKIIGYAAFKNCESLRNATLNEGLKSIGDHAFSGCENLKYIIVPNGNTSIRNLLTDPLDPLRGKIIEKQHYDRAYKVVKDAFSQAIYDPLGVPDLLDIVAGYALDNTDFSKILADVEIPRDTNEKSWSNFESIIQSKLESKNSSGSSLVSGIFNSGKCVESKSNDSNKPPIPHGGCSR